MSPSPIDTRARPSEPQWRSLTPPGPKLQESSPPSRPPSHLLSSGPKTKESLSATNLEYRTLCANSLVDYVEGIPIQDTRTTVARAGNLFGELEADHVVRLRADYFNG